MESGNGNPFLGPEGLVNTTTQGGQSASASAVLLYGRYVVVWEDQNGENRHVKAQVFDATGVRISAELSVSSATGRQGLPSFAALADGGFVISYTRIPDITEDATNYDVIAARYDAAGVQPVSVVAVATAANVHEYVSYVTALETGYAIAYQRGDQFFGDIALKIYDAADVQVGSTVSIGSGSATGRIPTDITTLSNGNIAVLWYDSSGTGLGIKARIFTTAGAAVSGEIAIARGFVEASIAALDTGGFAVAWTELQSPASYPDTSGSSIQGRIFDAAGTALTDRFTVNSTVADSQVGATVTAIAGGHFMVGWHGPDPSGNEQVFAQVIGYSGNGIAEFHGPETMLNRYPSEGVRVGQPQLVTLRDGSVVATWNDAGGTLGDTSGPGVHQVRLGPLVDIQYGTTGNDVIHAVQRSSEIHRLAGSDILIGGGVADQIYGEAGDDWIETSGLPGINRLHGEAGSDSYAVHSRRDCQDFRVWAGG